jgi:HK97 gp10 family phage protein
MPFTSHISGLKELQQQLQSMPSHLQNKVMRPALEDAGAIIQQEAGVRAPRRTGYLTTHLVIKVTLHGHNGDVKVGPGKGAWYGWFSEVGTVPHTETSKDGRTWDHPGEPARPWLRPAFLSVQGKVTDALIKNINDGLDEIVSSSVNTVMRNT